MFNDKPSDIVISLSDILPIAKKFNLPIENPEDLKSILWKMGLDIFHKKGYEVTSPLHRNMKGEVYKCQRYWGRERTDEEYIEMKESIQ